MLYHSYTPIKYDRNLAIVVDKTYGGTILHWAAELGEVEVVKLCLATKQAPLLLSCKSKNGSTPLHNATFRGHKEIVELLIEAGANKYTKNNSNKSALELAQDKQLLEIIEILEDRPTVGIYQ